MERDKIKLLFEEFVKTYDEKKSKEIWNKQSKQFREFWRTRVMKGDDDLTEDEMQPIIRILDYNAKGIRGSGVEPVGRTMIPQGAWYRFFISLKKNDELKSLLDGLFSAKSTEQEIRLINLIYEKGAEIKYLTGKNAILLNDLMFVANPEKNISILSLDHRYCIIDTFGMSRSDDLKGLSQGEQIIRTREIIIGWKSELGIDVDNRGFSRAFYKYSPAGIAINKLWSKSKPRRGRVKKSVAEAKSGLPSIDEKYIVRFLQVLACSPPQPFMVDALSNLDKAGKIIFNTEFQRSEVWDLPRKQKLIDSIMRGYNINTIFFRQVADGKYECLDGQQRLKTILRSFLNDEFPINPKYSPEFNRETYYSELPDALKNKIRSYIIYAIVFYTTEDEETCKIFLRLQEGLPLNSAEKLNAMMGNLRNEIVSLAGHPFMSKLGIKNHRFTHRYILAQLYLIILRKQVTDVKFRYLQEIYNTYRTELPPMRVANSIRKILNFLQEQFGDTAQVIKFNADFISLCLLANNILENYAIDSVSLGLKEFFINFMIRVNKTESGEKEDEIPFYEYNIYRKTSADSKGSIEKRFNIILSKFLEFNPDIKPKDPERSFDYWQKLAVYWRDKGFCQLKLEGCKQKTSFDDGTVDHIIPHSKGGLTTVANGQWACINCNLKKGAR